MPDPNPYSSPAAREPREGRRKAPQYRSRTQAARGEFGRGMKLGGACMGGIATVLVLMFWMLIAAIVAYRWQRNAVFDPPPRIPLLLAGSLGAIVLPSFCGAIAGGLLMAIAAAIGYRKPADDPGDCGLPQ